MKTIYIFGDSYAEQTNSSNNFWPVILKDIYSRHNIEIEIQNFARSGSSLGYSLDQLYKKTLKKDMKKDDIVVFCLTHPDRLFTVDMPNPNLGMIANLNDNNLQHREWISDNKQHLFWAAEKMFDDSINYEIPKVMSFLKVFSEINPDSLIIVFNNFHHPHKDFQRLVKSTNNFFNLCHGVLHSITKMECGYNEESANIEDYKLNFSGFDDRSNHFTYANCCIFADMLFDVIQNKDPSRWEWDRFQKFILRYYEPKK